MRGLRLFLIDCLILAIFVGGGYWLYLNHNAILDWYYLRNYTPPTAVAQLADQAQLTDQGRKLFYRAQPQIDSGRPQLVQDCKVANDKTIELGCYLSTDQIYLLDIKEPALRNEMIVTAAHETLHAAYDRLGGSERRRINSELEQVASQLNDPQLKQRLADYNLSEPGEQDNELHSIIGTEYGNLPPDLEAHYAKYLSNRAQIVAYSNQFNQTFDGLHAEIVQLDGQIKTTKEVMQRYLSAGQVRAYNALVPSVNADITTYNQKVVLYNQYASELLGQESAAGTQ